VLSARKERREQKPTVGVKFAMNVCDILELLQNGSFPDLDKSAFTIRSFLALGLLQDGVASHGWRYNCSFDRISVLVFGHLGS
jgi:hypothetical protein